MNKILSFIIPAYNAEPYLNKCINSLLESAVLEKIEIIIVNDGSTDNTQKIADTYVERFPDTCRLINKENGGHGSAINIGILNASGKYVKVLDADDWVLSSNLKEFISVLTQISVDVVLTNYHTVNIKTGEQISYFVPFQICNKIYNLEQILKNWSQIHSCITLHGLTYNREFYLSTGINLTEHVYYEDQEYNTLPGSYAKSFYICDLFLYEYMIGNSSQSMALENQIKRFKHLKTVIEHMLSYETVIADYGDYAKEFYYRKAEVALMAYYKLMCLAFRPRREGRRIAGELAMMLKKEHPFLYDRVKKRYYLFILMSYLHVTIFQFERLMQLKNRKF